MRPACLSLSAPPPVRRPLRLALSALSPPSLSSATHLFTARRLALNTCAAWTCFIPARTAFTACRRSNCCAAGSSFLASSRLFIPALTHHALFGARISIFLSVDEFPPHLTPPQSRALAGRVGRIARTCLLKGDN